MDNEEIRKLIRSEITEALKPVNQRISELASYANFVQSCLCSLENEVLGEDELPLRFVDLTKFPKTNNSS